MHLPRTGWQATQSAASKALASYPVTGSNSLKWQHGLSVARWVPRSIVQEQGRLLMMHVGALAAV
jgi:hypothetical protein